MANGLQSLPGQYPSAGVLINDQLLPVFAGTGLMPKAPVGPTWMGTGAAPQSIPAGVGGNTPNIQTGLAGGGLGGMSLTGKTGLVLAACFLVGFLGLRYIHWG